MWLRASCARRHPHREGRQYSAAARQQILAAGISKAMLTTAMGLVTAVPMMVFHTILTARMERIMFSV
ncbi:MAG: MotA/TolQ/ExbB proton channel family protein, partial [Delftia sp.]|nr:MotA/TolQ/ExbB proton channel family protein [Delftia sp.]